MLRILGRANSFNVRKVLWLCDEIGLPFEREDYGRGFRPTNTPEFLKLNPVGQVPCVIDDGFVMRESHAIVRYLAAKHGATALYPADLKRRQAIEAWMDWVAYDVTHSMRGAFLGGQLKEAPWNNEWFVAQGRKDLTVQMKLLDDHLTAHGPYVLGKDFTLADIPMGLVVNRWFSLTELKRPDYPAVARYYELLTERPAYRAHGRNGLP
ncbi:MAG: glutathione S-transferase family protein [Burkholderiales bacterium]